MNRPANHTFTERFCRQFQICPDLSEAALSRIWTCDQTDVSILSYVNYRIGSQLAAVRVSETELAERIARVFSEDKGELSGSEKATRRVGNGTHSQSNGKIVKEINDIVSRCIRSGASDIHFEPGENRLLCRARIDGILQKLKQIPLENTLETISRIKIMSGLDIAEKRRPQDGRIRFPIDNRVVDIRVSVIPTDFGEKAVLRLLDKQSLRLDLNELGFSRPQLELFLAKISVSNGIILVTGPTGSGKTTTLYAALQHLRSPEVNISTVEDPIEYNLEGINQTQVKPDINLTFSAMLRSLLRQDPNIIMVGEIRDRETLDIAIRASQTGHLVLSTLHTNGAIATVTRLLDMGAEPYMLASSLRLIVAQRLIRKLCPACITSELREADLQAADRLSVRVDNRVRSSNGCKNCHNTGYVGRSAIYELLPIDGDLNQAVSERRSEREMLQIARKNSFETMAETAAERIYNGVTGPTEVLRELST